MFVNDATRQVAQEYLHEIVLRVGESIIWLIIKQRWRKTIVYSSRKYPYTHSPWKAICLVPPPPVFS